jgi:hypothetical protein
MVKEDPERVELRHGRIGTGTHTVLGIVIGYASFYLAAVLGNWLTVLTGIVVLILFGYVLERFLGNRGIKWWFGNGVVVYLFIWLVSWTFFLNLMG